MTGPPGWARVGCSKPDNSSTGGAASDDTGAVEVQFPSAPAASSGQSASVAVTLTDCAVVATPKFTG